jgi:alkyl sulfatase BDS1-like metallo-beta-lactamase superfamily hydrolase
MNKTLLFSSILSVTLLSACGDKQSDPIATDSAASAATIAANKAVYDSLDFADTTSFEQANRGLIAAATDEDITLANDPDRVIFNGGQYDFLTGDAPDTVNPSLWRQSQLNNIRGLFQVTDGVYQLRGFDLANMTLIEGKTGWIVIDPLTSAETAANALAFATKHLGAKPVSTIIFTHSHIDHFGGAFGIATPEQVKEQGITVIAPEGFVAESTSENLTAGPAMSRRANYMYGMTLPISADGHIGTGLGLQPVAGTTTILRPNVIIDQPLEDKVVDGILMTFQNAPHSEAPAELTFYMPEKKLFLGAEVVSQTMHNLYTLRGAKVRDALKWADYIEEERVQFADAEIYAGSHHWPIWGNAMIDKFLANQRDMYRFIHDQTVRMANNGLTPNEIAEQIELPEALSNAFYNRGYYGTLSHNSKAVYQYYFGWYDGNPANLNPLPPTAAGIKMVEYMGGVDVIMEKAQKSYDNGDYRWVAEVLNKVVFSGEATPAVKALLAESYQQLAYQAESGPWRGAYLSAAKDLVDPQTIEPVPLANAYSMVVEAPMKEFMTSLAVRLNAEKAAGVELSVILNLPDINEAYSLDVYNSVLHYKLVDGANLPAADATLNISHPEFISMMVGKIGLTDILSSDTVNVDGSTLDLIKFFSMIDIPKGDFNIVTP